MVPDCQPDEADYDAECFLFGLDQQGHQIHDTDESSSIEVIGVISEEEQQIDVGHNSLLMHMKSKHEEDEP